LAAAEGGGRDAAQLASGAVCHAPFDQQRVRIGACGATALRRGVQRHDRIDRRSHAAQLPDLRRRRLESARQCTVPNRRTPSAIADGIGRMRTNEQGEGGHHGGDDG
jgi:hypothetical protein